jgi:hypothetical protein
MRKTFPLLFLATAFLASCSGSNSTSATGADVLAGNDFESLDGWAPPSPSLTRDLAHSGKYSVKIDGNTEFSLGYSAPLGKLSNVRIQKIKIQAWAYMVSANSKARLGIQLIDNNTNKEIFGDGINYGDQIKQYGAWTEITKEVTLPSNITATQVFKLFLWRSGASDTAYLDDVRITKVE